MRVGRGAIAHGCFVLAAMGFGPGLATAQSSGDGFEELDLDRLLSLEVSVASIKSVSLRESPGIVSVITREEMLAYGARDLVDVLMMVPGFSFGVDVQGVVGLGVRGNWAHEGKVLLLIDDFEMNELNYQTLQLGHHYPVENLERIEIIRGPGSAIYGGNAELGVIKVVTRGADDIQGGRVSFRYGTPSKFYGKDGDSTGFVDGMLEAGMTHGDFAWTFTGFLGRSVRSEEQYIPLTGDDPYGMADASTLSPKMLAASASYGRTKLRLMWDGFGHASRDGFDVPTEFVHDYLFGGLFAELGTAITLAPGLELIPRLSWKRQRTYWSTFDNEEEFAELVSPDFGLYQQQALMRVLGGVTVSWDAFDEASLIVGVEVFYDRGERIGDREETLDANSYLNDAGEQVGSIEFLTTALFTQFLWPNEWINVTVGGRLEIHDVFGIFAVPRLALTKVFDSGVHVKLLAAQAFRTPSLQNKSLEKTVDQDNEVKRERTSVLEAELGYELLDGLKLTGNVFYTQIDDPLVYVYDGDIDAETYYNSPASKTAGVELQAGWRARRVDAQLSYSYYQTVGETIEDYAVPGRHGRLGSPRHKIAARIGFEVLPQVWLTPTAVVLGDRWAYTADDPDAPRRLDDVLLLGLAVNANDLFTPGFGASLAAHNLLDATDLFPQPYFGGHGTLPGPGRQIMLRLSYAYER